MKKIPLTKQQMDMLEKAIRFTISDLQYEQHQAMKHGCSGAAYDDEIRRYKELKSLFLNEDI